MNINTSVFRLDLNIGCVCVDLNSDVLVWERGSEYN